jgi:hypothetical protein
LAWDVLTHFYREIDRAGAADGLPAFDITRNCKPETAGASIEGPESCTKDETDAKNQLAKRWSSYSASRKKECVGESTTGEELRRTFDLPRNVNRPFFHRGRPKSMSRPDGKFWFWE